MTKTTFATILSSIALLAATPVAAYADAARVSVTVQTADLDLTTTEGRAQLNERIDDAANRVCRDNSARGLHMRRQYEACKTQIARNSAPQIEMAVASAFAAKDPRVAVNSVAIKIAG